MLLTDFTPGLTSLLLYTVQDYLSAMAAPTSIMNQDPTGQ